jgi:hypothetical protein
MGEEAAWLTFCSPSISGSSVFGAHKCPFSPTKRGWRKEGWGKDKEGWSVLWQ